MVMPIYTRSNDVSGRNDRSMHGSSRLMSYMFVLLKKDKD